MNKETLRKIYGDKFVENFEDVDEWWFPDVDERLFPGWERPLHSDKCWERWLNGKWDSTTHLSNGFERYIYRHLKQKDDPESAWPAPPEGYRWIALEDADGPAVLTEIVEYNNSGHWTLQECVYASWCGGILWGCGDKFYTGFMRRYRHDDFIVDAYAPGDKPFQPLAVAVEG